MSWDYQWAIDGTTLTTYCTNVRLLAEKRAGLRGRDFEIPWRQGSRHTTGKYYQPVVLPLEFDLRYTNAAGAVTHTDGGPGHVFENMQAVKALMGSGQFELQRTAPDQGAVEIDVEVIDEIVQTVPRFRYVALCSAVFPFWREQTATTTAQTFTGDTSMVVTQGGNVPSHNAVIAIFADGQPVTNVALENSTTGQTITYGGTIDAGDTVTIDVGAGTVVHDADGNVDAVLSVDHAEWMRLNVGANTINVTSDAGTRDFDVTFTHPDLWHT